MSDLACRKRVHIHAGIHKTGSTSIQSFVTKNIGRMHELGWYVHPDRFQGGEINHAALVNSIRSGVDELVGHFIEGFLRSECACALLISEEFEYLSASDLQFMVDQLANFDISASVYVRRQDALIESEYRECVKNGAFFGDFSSFARDVNVRERYLYPRLAERWLRELPSKVTFLPFDRRFFKNGDLIEDFLNVINLSRDQVGDHEDYWQNTALTALGVQIALFAASCLFLRANCEISASKFATIVRTALQRCLENIPEVFDSKYDYPLLTTQLAEEIMGYYSAANVEFGQMIGGNVKSWVDLVGVELVRSDAKVVNGIPRSLVPDERFAWIMGKVFDDIEYWTSNQIGKV